jgi:hypothetical protein
MKLDNLTSGQMKFDMNNNIRGIISKHPEQLPENMGKCLGNKDFLKRSVVNGQLKSEKARLFHSFMDNLLF